MNKYSSLLWGLLFLLTGLFVSRLYNYLLFHSLAELFAIVIACGMFLIAWNVRKIMTNHYVLFIGIAYLFVALLDAFHMFTFKGMRIISPYDPNISAQFWISARYLESLALLVSPFMLRHRINATVVMTGFGFACLLVILSILQWDIFPECYREGLGLTHFKIYSEYAIALILVAAGARLYARRRLIDPTKLRWMLASIGFTVASEIIFTGYVQAYDTLNLIGHLLKIISYFCVYKAIIETGLRRPYALLFRDLKNSEQAMQRAGEVLEESVRKRTADLQNKVQQLSDEIEKRMAAENMLRRLSRKSIDALENERQSVSREVHDSIGASLAAIKHMLEDVLNDISTGKADTVDRIEKAAFFLADTIQETRRISSNLRPLSLEELGLLATLRAYSRQFEGIYESIRVDLHIEAEESQIPEQLKIVLYRIIQEALNNVGQHSNADHVNIMLKTNCQRIHFQISDDGKGFDMHQRDHTEREGGGLGIQSMRERTELIGGQFSIISSRNRGTSIVIDLPLYDAI